MPAGSILVADDDTAIRTVLNQALSRAGYEVRLTGNAATLWRWVSQGEGDLVITDVVMPDENAFDLLRRHSQALNIKLAEVARAVIENRGRLPSLQWRHHRGSRR